MSKITGTLSALAGTVSVNGRNLDAVALSTLTRLGNGSFARAVGTEKKPASADGKVPRGKPATIWEIDTDVTFSFGAAVAEAAPEAPATVEPEAQAA